MPELPEVETVRLSLEPLILGARIGAINELTPGVLINLAGVETQAVDWRITALRRRGKYLLIDLVDDLLLVAHLRMTGQFIFQDPPSSFQKHDHISILLEKNQDSLPNGKFQLVFHDTRRFGRIWLLKTDQLPQLAGLAGLGPEPLDHDLTGKQLRDRLKRRARTSLKAALLDQTVIAGLGNIYVDETLFLARISPNRAAGSISLTEIERLLGCMREVLTRAVHARGTSVKDYVDALNVRGSFQYQLQVYGRGGQPCTNCGAPLNKIVLAGRTTVYCPHCQPDPKVPKAPSTLTITKSEKVSKLGSKQPTQDQSV